MVVGFEQTVLRRDEELTARPIVTCASSRRRLRALSGTRAHLSSQTPRFPSVTNSLQMSDELPRLCFTYRLCTHPATAPVICTKMGHDMVVLISWS